MNIEALMKLNDAHKARLRELAQQTEAALDAINGCPISMKQANKLEAELAKKAAIDEELKGLAGVRGAGFDAAKAGKAREECPYPEDSLERLYWYRGWCQAKNVMPFSEIPMETMFKLDRPIRHFCQSFRITTLLNQVAKRIHQAQRPGEAWGAVAPYSQKLYQNQAIALLEALMDTDPNLSVLPKPDEKPLVGRTEALPSA